MKLIQWIKNLFYKLFNKKKMEEELEKKKKEEELIYYKKQKISKLEIFSQSVLGFMLGLLERSASKQVRIKDIEDLIDLDKIKYEIRELEKEESWLTDKIKLETNIRKKESYQKKLDNIKDNIRILKGRANLIASNREKAQKVFEKLKKLDNDVDEIRNEISRIKKLSEEERDPEVIEKYRNQIKELQEKIKNVLEENEKISKHYDKYQNDEEIHNKTEKIKENAQEILPSILFLSTSLVEDIVFTNKEVKNSARVVKSEARNAIKDLEKREEEEKERIKIEKMMQTESELNELTETEKEINDLVKKQNSEIEKLKKRVENAKVESKQRVHFRGMSKMVLNFSKMTIGFMAFTRFKNPGVGLILGAVLINNSIRGLRNALRLNKRRIIYYKYTDITNEIIKQKSTINVATKLFDDSIKQITLFKAEFLSKFQDDLAKIPEFGEILNKVDLVEKEIRQKQEVLKENEKKVEKLEEKNNRNKEKVKVLKRDI